MQNHADSFSNGKNVASRRARDACADEEMLIEAVRGHLLSITYAHLGKLYYESCVAKYGKDVYRRCVVQ